MPDKAVKEGETYEKSWTGLRSEKGKKGKFAFKQRVKVEKIETRDGKKLVTLSSDLTGTLDKPAGEGPKPGEEAWTKCEGKTRIVLDAESGRVVSSEGSGGVTTYFSGPAEDGSKNEVTIKSMVVG
ncbi:hypothetical protein HY251_02375, partial [bacterium]|nr:hypothetical protein [bacterium]